LTPRYEAVIVAVAGEETAVVVMVKFAVKLAAGTVTFAGTTRLALLLERETSDPPTGAVPVRVTVPVTVVPPMTSIGADTAESAVAWTCRTAVAVRPDRLAVMVAFFVVMVPRVVAWNVRDDVPCKTVTVDGTVTAVVSELERFTTTPPAGANPSSVTVPVEGVPAGTEVGLTATVQRPAGLTVVVPESVVPA
jgi:hypothetical protein